jgi:hypothetical protein
VDFSSLPKSDAGLDFKVDCPGQRDGAACTADHAGKRFDDDSESSVYMWPGVRTVNIVVYDEGSQNIVAQKSTEPVPWDPPEKPNTCAMPAKATLKL